MQHPAGKLLETSGTSRVELQLSQLLQSSFERRFLRCLTAFSTALVAGSSSRQMVFVDYDIKKKRWKMPVMPVFSEVLSKFLKCTAVGNLVGITACNFFLTVPTVGLETQATASKPLIK